MPPRLVGQERVLRLAVADPVEVVRQHALQEVVRARTADLDLPHVGHVEHAGGRPDGPVLVVDARVVDGHVPAAEVDHPGAERKVARVQRCRPRGQHGCLSAQWSGRTGRKHTCVVRGWPGRIRPRLPAGGSDSMRRPATLIGLVLATTLSAPAAAHAAAAAMLFPVVGGASYVDDYGDARPQGRHQGNDLMAPKHTPVIAVADGVVRLQHSGRGGYMLYLRNSSHEWLYIHLNNDVRGNDGRGGPKTAYARGLRSGMRVRAGQEIAYVGNSGDAEGGPAHLHFEEHTRRRPAARPVPAPAGRADRAVLGRREQALDADRAHLPRPADLDRGRRQRRLRARGDPPHQHPDRLAHDPHAQAGRREDVAGRGRRRRVDRARRDGPHRRRERHDHARPPADATGSLGGGVHRRPVSVLRAIRAFPPHGWLMFGLEMLLLFAVNAVYEVTRALLEGPADVALAHAHDIIRAERALGIFVERDIQQWALDAPGFVVDVARWTYQNCQRLITWSFVIWLYLRRNAFFPRVRNTIITLDVLGLARLLPLPDGAAAADAGLRVRRRARPDAGEPALVAGRVADEPVRRRPEPALRLRAAARHHRLPGLPAPGDAR